VGQGDDRGSGGGLGDLLGLPWLFGSGTGLLSRLVCWYLLLLGLALDVLLRISLRSLIILACVSCWWLERSQNIGNWITSLSSCVPASHIE